MTKPQKIKSVITSDMEGRIETFNEGAEHIFGYKREEVIGKKRVSLFSPGQVVLEHVPTWLKIASEEGEFRTKTIFLHRDGTPIPAEIQITPTFKDGEQIGYCGITEVLDDIDPEEVTPKISTATKIFTWLVITRAPFLTAMIMPILIGSAWVASKGLSDPFPSIRFWMILLGGIFLQLAANTLNDFFDWKSGTDQANNDYFLPYTGGSRSLELGLIDENSLFRFGLISMLLSATIGVALAVISGPGIFVFGLIGAFSAYYYTAPPLRLAARRGLGELTIGLNFGPLATAGTVYALTGQVTPVDFLIGVPIGLLVIAILWINQFPDEDADEKTGKINLVVVLGKQRARWGYLLLMLAAFSLTLYWSLKNIFPDGTILFLGGIPLAIYASIIVVRRYDDRNLIRANVTTIQLHALAGLLMAIGLLVNDQIIRFLGIL